MGDEGSKAHFKKKEIWLKNTLSRRWGLEGTIKKDRDKAGKCAMWVIGLESVKAHYLSDEVQSYTRRKGMGLKGTLSDY